MVMLRDFNALVGSRASGNEEWWYERGPHGHGALNETGRELLSFPASMRPSFATPGLQRRTFTNRLGSTPSQNSGTALTMPS